MRLTCLKPRVPAANLSRVKPAQLGNQVERKRGAAGVADRERIRRRDNGLCQECARQGRVSVGCDVDHIVPLWQGGANDKSNLELLCRSCHQEKTAREARMRATGQA